MVEPVYRGVRASPPSVAAVQRGRSLDVFEEMPHRRTCAGSTRVPYLWRPCHPSCYLVKLSGFGLILLLLAVLPLVCREMMGLPGLVVDAAIGWLVQTILGSYFTEQIEAWTREIGLAEDVEKLKFEMRNVEMVLAAAEGRRIENKPLASSLDFLKELLYDSEDVMDELDYYRLQQQIEKVTWGDPGRMHEAERVDERSRGRDANIPSTSGGKKWYKAWGDFDITEENNEKPVKAKFKHCQKAVNCGSHRGMPILHNHVRSEGCKNLRASEHALNSSSTCDATANAASVVIGDSFSRKRRRDEVLTETTAANKVTEATFPSLEELVLIEMPKLEKCSSSSMWDLNSSLRVLDIKMCSALKVFDLLEDDIKFKSEQKSWLPGLRKLIIYNCPHLKALQKSDVYSI
ncbi:hypothetical protein ZWY2020_054921 [Hordeum vulgare]|nr:hypothetical protein ZWY2020_054921 [Hordeum vulgare]